MWCMWSEIRSHLFTCQVWMLRGEVELLGFPTAFMQKPHGLEKPTARCCKQATRAVKVLSDLNEHEVWT